MQRETETQRKTMMVQEHHEEEERERRRRTKVQREINQSAYAASGEKQAPIQRKEPKIGRNDLCVCGSGKKYKKCCGQ